MKKIFFVLLTGLTLISCGKEDLKLEAFNPEAFAFDIGDTWEVNASAQVRGFLQVEENEMFKASLAFSVDLITPSGDTIAGLITRVEDLNNNEKVLDTSLEAQFELDSTYAAGKYNVVFNVKDVNNNQTATTAASFEITEE
ncbi:MAG: hypothetical protein IPM56_16845 [Ignavibacteriales bacterium]|nr:MAG: hypothetical protein IPM56_16845 [Ignavibacteriales bacterium]